MKFLVEKSKCTKALFKTGVERTDMTIRVRYFEDVYLYVGIFIPFVIRSEYFPATSHPHPHPIQVNESILQKINK